jgi:hypothetical protein
MPPTNGPRHRLLQTLPALIATAPKAELLLPVPTPRKLANQSAAPASLPFHTPQPVSVAPCGCLSRGSPEGSKRADSHSIC